MSDIETLLEEFWAEEEEIEEMMAGIVWRGAVWTTARG